MSSTTYYHHCEHCKPDQESCSESHFRPCGKDECRGGKLWKTVSQNEDGTKSKTRIYPPPVDKKAVEAKAAEQQAARMRCWTEECTTACSKHKCWFEAREEGESLIPEEIEDEWESQLSSFHMPEPRNNVLMDQKVFDEMIRALDLPPTASATSIPAYRKNRKSDLITHADIADIIDDTLETIHDLNATKGLEYASEADGLANFKNRSAQLGLTPMQVWGIFYGKHSDAIYSYLRNGEVLSEAIEGRIDDAILYLILLKGLIREQDDN